jgi:hypothetical protein
MGDGSMYIWDVEIYSNTPAWELAQAVNKQDTRKIDRIAKETPEIIDYQDPTYSTSLLVWAVGMEKYRSAEALLKAGANTEIISEGVGGTALFLASRFSFIDRTANTDPKYVKLLLQYGADPNACYVLDDENSISEIGTSPLMVSIGCGIEKTMALVEGGADINHKTPRGYTAALISLGAGVYTYTAEEMKYAYYLIVEKRADITSSYNPKFSYDPDYLRYPVDALRYWMPKLDTEAYKMKMEIVEEFARQGVDYWATSPNEHMIAKVKITYPDTWEEYLARY